MNGFLTALGGRLTWRHWAWATGIGVLVTLSQLPLHLHSPMFDGWGKVSTELPHFLAFSYVFMLAVVLAECSAPLGALVPMRRYLGAAMLALFVCLAWIWSFPIQPPPSDRAEGQRLAAMYEKGVWDKRRFNMAWLGPATAVHGIIAVLVYAWLRNGRLTARALADAEIRRTESESRMVASRLESVRSEVDPAFLLATLGEIEQAYEVNRDEADAMLDELIAFLRAAIPRVRGAGAGPAVPAPAAATVA